MEDRIFSNARTLVAKPHSCDVERLVSAYNLFKDDDRCSLSAETVDAYLHVHINMPVLADFDPRPVLTLWTRKSDRRPHDNKKASTLKSITASIIQGSGIGPAAYVVNASDLKAVTPGNQLCKFADDTYLVIPATNVDSRATEIDNIETWARTNNLTLKVVEGDRLFRP